MPEAQVGFGFLIYSLAFSGIHAILLSRSGVEVLAAVASPTGTAKAIVGETVFAMCGAAFLRSFLRQPGGALVWIATLGPSIGYLLLAAAWWHAAASLRPYDGESAEALSASGLITSLTGIVAVTVTLAGLRREQHAVLCPRRQTAIRVGTLIVVTAGVALTAVMPGPFGLALGAPLAAFLGLSWLLLAMAGIVRLPSMLVRAGAPRKVVQASRWTAMIILAWFIVGLSANTHEVRTLPQTMASFAVAQRRTPTMEDAIRRWYEVHRDSNGQAAMVIVASAGGGARAAYWTAAVLSKLDSVPGFREHLFALSSVSGGSLGAIAFNAALASERVGSKRCAGGLMGVCLRAFIARDFLGPLLTGWLFSDVLRIFLPFLPIDDRAAALENAWEVAWRDAFGDDMLSLDFVDLWATDADPIAAVTPKMSAPPWPALAVNGTSLKTGTRIVTSNLLTWPEPGIIRAIPPAGNPVRFIRMRASTVANTSARFPVLEPPGMIVPRIRLYQGQLYFIEEELPSGIKLVPGYGDYVVDGGYFDNFGAASVLDVLRKVSDFNCELGTRPRPTGPCAPQNGRDPAGILPRIFPIVVQITSDPEIKRAFMSTYTCMDEPQAPFSPTLPVAAVPAFTEVLAPLLTLYELRSTNGLFYAQELAARPDVAGYFHFGLGEAISTDPSPGTRVPVPTLNWVLSPSSREQIDARLTQCYDLQAAPLESIISEPRRAAEIYRERDSVAVRDSNRPKPAH